MTLWLRFFVLNLDVNYFVEIIMWTAIGLCIILQPVSVHMIAVVLSARSFIIVGIYLFIHLFFL